jgi:hypothetical protein
MDDVVEKQKKRTELNDGDRKVLYKYANHYSGLFNTLQNVESCNVLGNSNSHTEISNSK